LQLDATGAACGCDDGKQSPLIAKPQQRCGFFLAT
jgi:hypothetical protein